MNLLSLKISKVLPLNEPVANERTRTGIRDVLVMFREFQQKTLEAENRIDKQKDCQDDPEYSKHNVTSALKNKETVRILRGPSLSRQYIVITFPEFQFKMTVKFRRERSYFYYLELQSR